MTSESFSPRARVVLGHLRLGLQRSDCSEEAIGRREGPRAPRPEVNVPRPENWDIGPALKPR